MQSSSVRRAAQRLRQGQQQRAGLRALPGPEREPQPGRGRLGAEQPLGWFRECPHGTSPEHPARARTKIASRTGPRTGFPLPRRPRSAPLPELRRGHGRSRPGTGLGAPCSVNAVPARAPFQPKPLRVSAAPPLSAHTGVSPRLAGPPAYRQPLRLHPHPSRGRGGAAVSRRCRCPRSHGIIKGKFNSLHP